MKYSKVQLTVSSFPGWIFGYILHKVFGAQKTPEMQILFRYLEQKHFNTICTDNENREIFW